MEFIDIKHQYRLYKNEINSAIQDVLDSGSFIMGPQVKDLEEKLASLVHVKHCITVSSGTDSLLIALMALNIGPGDQVITTPFSWISSTEVIALAGATPVFIDIDPATYNIDVSKIEMAITDKTKAILPVGLFGQMPDLISINKIAKKYNLTVIEDGAQSFGAEQFGIKSCGASAIGSTSFFPSKTLGCYGDGGALFTNDDALAGKMRAIRTHGGEQRHHHPYVGMNGRLDTLQAAILLAKLPHFDDEILARKRIGKRYTEHLNECCITPTVLQGNTHVYHQYTIRVPNRDAVVAELRSQNIPTAVYYPKCIHEQPVFSHLGYKIGSLPNAESISREVLSLPMHPWLTFDDQDLVINCVKNSLLATSFTG